eukprot:4641736-Pleurochrysis_carterae.AAC.3
MPVAFRACVLTNRKVLSVRERTGRHMAQEEVRRVRQGRVEGRVICKMTEETGVLCGRRQPAAPTCRA